jgi:hypothetical protein
MSYDGDALRGPVLHVVWGWSAQTAPQVANALPSGVSSTSETLAGDLLSAGGSTTAVWLYWGTSDGGTNKLAWGGGVGLGVASEGRFQTTVSGLTPNTVYYCRAYALNSVGDAWADSSAQFATLSGSDVTNGLVLHWKLDEATGTIAADSSGHGNDGTVVNVGAGDRVAGRFGTALDISGGNPHVFKSNLTAAISGDMTLSCWIVARSPAGVAMDLVSATGDEWQMREDGALGRLGWENAGGPATPLYTTWSLHLDGLWHHVAFVREGTAYRLYVDDRFVGTAGGTAVSYSALWAGRGVAGAGWQGKIDDVRLYNRALSWGEIGSLQAGEGLGLLDADADGMPDVWETDRFGSVSAVNGAADYDKDGDGLKNLEEYILGTDPNVETSCLALNIALIKGQVVVSYPTVRAAGMAYMGKSRFYDLQGRGGLIGGTWAPVPGATNVPGSDAWVTFTNALPDSARAFRVKARLE